MQNHIKAWNGVVIMVVTLRNSLYFIKHTLSFSLTFSKPSSTAILDYSCVNGYVIVCILKAHFIIWPYLHKTVLYGRYWLFMCWLSSSSLNTLLYLRIFHILVVTWFHGVPWNHPPYPTPIAKPNIVYDQHGSLDRLDYSPTMGVACFNAKLTYASLWQSWSLFLTRNPVAHKHAKQWNISILTATSSKSCSIRESLQKVVPTIISMWRNFLLIVSPITNSITFEQCCISVHHPPAEGILEVNHQDKECIINYLYTRIESMWYTGG